MRNMKDRSSIKDRNNMKDAKDKSFSALPNDKQLKTQRSSSFIATTKKKKRIEYVPVKKYLLLKLQTDNTLSRSNLSSNS